MPRMRHDANALLNKGTEQVDYSYYLVAYPSEFREGRTPYAIDVENYTEGKTEIHCHIRVRLGESEDYQRCLVYHRNIPGKNFHKAGWLDRAWKLAFGFFHQARPDEDGAVLVLVVDGSKNRKRVVGLPSDVRLLILDDCPYWAAKRPNAVPDLFPLSVSVRDWKHEAPVIRWGISPALADRNCIDDVVKSAPQIASAVTDNCSPSDARWRVELDPRGYLGRVSIVLESDGIGVRVPDDLEGTLQFLEVFFSHAELGINTGEEWYT
jgi:hypothetical protein